jgi:excisionase family DNA binding protein
MAYPNPFDSLESRLSNIEKLLLDIYGGAHIKPPDNNPNGLLTVDQAADLLHLAIPTIYGLIHRREISSLKRGRRVYFKKEDLLQYLEDGRRNAKDALGHKRSSITKSYKKGNAK